MWHSEVVICVLLILVHFSYAAKGILKINTTDGNRRLLQSKTKPWLWPHSLTMAASLQGENLRLNMNRDLDQERDIPLFIFYPREDGVNVMKKTFPSVDMAIYKDPKNSAAFAFVHTKISDDFNFSLMGIIQKGNQMYEIKGKKWLYMMDRRNQSSHTISDDAYDETMEVEVHLHNITTGDDHPDSNTFHSRDASSSESHRLKREPNDLSIVDPSSFLTRLPTGMKRESTQDVYIDVVALADFGVYTAWYRRTKASVSEKQDTVLKDIYQYYALVYYGVDMMYQSIASLPYSIHIKLSGIIVATNASSSPWTEDGKQSSSASEWDTVVASRALNSLTSWADNSTVLPPYDHLQLFSGYDLTDDFGSIKTTGLAWTGTLCATNGTASSVVEDLGGFHCVNTAAHEIGHTLSANHDGDGNMCNSGDGYIMSNGLYFITEDNKLNRWRFSPCSIQSFNQFITNTERTPHGRQCLHTTDPTGNDVPDVTSVMAGQLYNVDEQCQQIHGPNSSLCRGIDIGDWSNVCTAMWCLEPLTDNYCGREVAARGTTCGDRKWCVDGQCVFDNSAPSTTDNCTLEDQPGAIQNGLTCTELLAQSPEQCSQSFVYRRCCKACNALTRSLGDPPPLDIEVLDIDGQCRRISGPNSTFCRGIDIGNASNVCHSMWCTVANLYVCQRETAPNGTSCGDRQWCIQGKCVFNVSAPAADNDCVFPDLTGVVDIPYNLTCQELVVTLPRKCYQDSIRRQCCHACASVLPSVRAQEAVTLSSGDPILSVDDQCRAMYGLNSSFCRGKDSDVCTSMWCLLPNGVLCWPEVADAGTTCADKQWCETGQCTPNPRAPTVYYDCPFEDLEGEISEGKTCAELMPDHVTQCQTPSIQHRCCRACASAAHPENPIG